MKEFKNYNLEELSQEDLLTIEGGKINGNFWFGLLFGLIIGLVAGSNN